MSRKRKMSMDVEATLPLSFASQPSGPKRRKVYAKRKYPKARKYKNFNRYSTILNRVSTGFPSTMVIKLKYAQAINYDNTGTPTVSNTQQFRLNSIYDPDFTGTGHQPYYRDEIAALYSNYVVYGCKVYMSANAVSAVPLILNIEPNISSATPTDSVLGAERPQARTLILDAGGQAQKFSRYYNMADLFGIKKEELISDDTYGAAMGANPTSQMYLNTGCRALDGTTVAKASAIFILTYYCVCLKRTENSGS